MIQPLHGASPACSVATTETIVSSPVLVIPAWTHGPRRALFPVTLIPVIVPFISAIIAYASRPVLAPAQRPSGMLSLISFGGVEEGVLVVFPTAAALGVCPLIDIVLRIVDIGGPCVFVARLQCLGVVGCAAVRVDGEGAVFAELDEVVG